MSRIGKKVIPIPSGVQVTVNGSDVKVKGKLGELSRTFLPEIDIIHEGASLKVQPKEQNKNNANLWGLSRTLLNNMIQGVSVGFSKVLEIRGVGYRAQVQGSVLNLALGYSHPIDYPIPEGIEIAVDKNVMITVKGADRELVGKTCANIRDYRLPEPYKGKGIRNLNEVVNQKVGKKK